MEFTSSLAFELCGNSLASSAFRCPLCRDLDGPALQNHELKLVVEYDKTRSNKCLGCRLLLDAILNIPKAWMIALLEASLIFRYDELKGLILNVVELGDTGRLVEFEVFSEESSWKCFPKRKLAASNRVEIVTKWASHQIAKCIEAHEDCRPGFSQSTLPKRVIDVRLTSANQGNDVRLYEPGEEVCKYACLSHCWGESQPLRTIKENLEDHKARIAWEAIPKTFQDAIMFTRRLGIPWIWIDSLCIVQDDEDDWRTEAANMAHVYGNSYICLASTHGSGANSGLLAQEIPWLKLNPVDDQDEEHQLSISFTKRCQKWLLEDLASNIYMRTLRREAPLLSRAWVLQERLLSPRVLHFLEQDIVFECLTGSYCSCGGNVKTRTSQFPKISHGRLFHKPSITELDDRWRQMVTAYSRNLITFPKDRLPAIAGLAEQMKLYRQDEYVAGLWKGTIERDLMWRALRENAVSAERYAPSWSWASMNSPLEFLELEESISVTCQIMKAESKTIGNTEHGLIELKGNIACLRDCQKIEFDAAIRKDYSISYSANETFLVEIARDEDGTRLRGIALKQAPDRKALAVRRLFRAIMEPSMPSRFERIGTFHIWSDNGGIATFEAASERRTIELV